MPGPGAPLIAAGVGIALRGFGKAVKNFIRAEKRQALGLPRKTYTQRMLERKARGKKLAVPKKKPKKDK